MEKENNLVNETTISYSRDLLTYSKEKRRLELITITSNDNYKSNQNHTSNKNLITVSSFNNFKMNQSNSIINNTKSYNNKNNTSSCFNINNNKITITNFSQIDSEPIINPYIPISASMKNRKQSNPNQYTNTNQNSNNFIINSKSKALRIPEKPIIFISARVHPGETPSSYLMNGILRFLLNKKDPRAEILRKAFVFKIIPIINVDGVSRGFYRYDTNSLNMNRHYICPGMKMQPEIYALKKVFLHFSQVGKIKYYFDLHAHASSRGLFLFGNYLDFLQQIENKMLPKLIEMNSEHLLFSYCNFSEKSMKSKDRGDKYSKEGTGRVHFNKVCDIIHCYTVEASYYRGINKNSLKIIKPINFNLLIENRLNFHKEKESLNGFRSVSIVENTASEFGNSNNAIISNNESSKKKKSNDKNFSLSERKSTEGNHIIFNSSKKIFIEKDENKESDYLLEILSNYFKIEIEKAYFGDKDLIKKILMKKNNKNNFNNKDKDKIDEDLDEYEKIKNINLNINLSFDSANKSKDNLNGNSDSSMNSSMCNNKSEGKNTNKLNQTNINYKNNIQYNLNMANDINLDEFDYQTDEDDKIEKYTQNEIKNRGEKGDSIRFNSMSNFNKFIKPNNDDSSYNSSFNSLSPLSRLHNYYLRNLRSFV